MPLQETGHIERAEARDLFPDIPEAQETVIHTEEILRETAHIAEEQPVQILPEELMEILLKEVLVIPGRHPPCPEPPAIVPEEVRGLEVHLVIEVPEGPEVQVAIEVPEGPEAQVATEVPGGLQDLLVA